MHSKHWFFTPFAHVQLYAPKNPRWTSEKDKENMSQEGGYRWVLEDTGRAFQERKIWGHFKSSPLAPSRLSAQVALGYNNCPSSSSDSHAGDGRWSSVSGHLRIQGGRTVIKDILIPHHLMEIRGPPAPSLPDHLTMEKSIGWWHFLFPSSPFSVGTWSREILFASGWQEMMKIHEVPSIRGTTGGLTCTGGQARIPEYSLSTFPKLSCLDAKSLQWRASQGCF